MLYVFFRIQRKNENIFKVWCYPYIPLDIEYSYNGIIEHTCFETNPFTISNFGIIDKMETQIRNMSFQRLISIFCSSIKDIYEAEHDC